MKKFKMWDVVAFAHDPSKIMRILDDKTLDLLNSDPTGITKVEDKYWVRIFYHDHCILSGARRLDPLYEDDNRCLIETMEGIARDREELFSKFSR